MIDAIFYHAATLITLLSLFILGPALGRAWMTRIDGSQGWSVPTQHFVTLAIGIPNSKTHIPAVLEQVRCGHIHPERLVTVHDWTEVPDALFSSDIKPVVVRPTIVNPAAKPAKLILPASD